MTATIRAPATSTARQNLERGLAGYSSVDLDRARAASDSLGRALALIQNPGVLGVEARKELDDALSSARSLLEEASDANARADDLAACGREALRELGRLERRALLSAAKVEALERARGEAPADAGASLRRRLELEAELRARLDELARLSTTLTEADRQLGETRSQLDAQTARLSEERRRRLEVQLELEALEDRHATFARERAALDESARTIRERFTSKTSRLYRAIVQGSPVSGEALVQSTRELMEASEALIRLKTDRDSLLHQVDRLRVALRRAKGLPDAAPLEEEDRVAASHEKLSLALSQLKDLIDRRFEEMSRSVAERRVPAPEPASPTPEPRHDSTRFYPEPPEPVAPPAPEAVAAPAKPEPPPPSPAAPATPPAVRSVASEEDSLEALFQRRRRKLLESNSQLTPIPPTPPTTQAQHGIDTSIRITRDAVRSALREHAARTQKPTPRRSLVALAAPQVERWGRVAVLALVPFLVWIGSVTFRAAMDRVTSRPRESDAPAPRPIEARWTGEIDGLAFRAWVAGMHAYSESIVRGETDPIPSGSFVALVTAANESAPGSRIRLAFDSAGQRVGLSGDQLLDLTQRIAVADQRITWSRQKGIQNRWTDDEVRADALASCGANPLGRRDLVACLERALEVQGVGNALFQASSEARAREATSGGSE